MNHLKHFENFNRFPDVFGDKLQRGVRMGVPEYIDDPQKRKVRIGVDRPYYRLFLENFKRIGLQDPTHSVHFYLRPKIRVGEPSMIGHYGDIYKVIPREDSKFSFSRQTRNGGLGSTWWTLERTLEDLNIIYVNNEEIDVNPNMVETLFKIFNLKSQKELKEVIRMLCDTDDGLVDLFENNRNEFLNIITCYQKLLIEFGLVGNLTYDELLKLSEMPGDQIQIWTESEVLHKKI